MIDYATAGDLLEAYGRAPSGPSMATRGSRSSRDDAEYHVDPFGAPLVGHNALRAYLLESARTQTDVDIHRRTPLGLGRHRPRGMAWDLRRTGHRPARPASPGS